MFARNRVASLVLFALWLVCVGYAASTHVFFRDEVRALSLALQGDNVFGMFRAIHGEGHPAVWYLLLRGAHTLIGRPEVLPLVALIVAAAAVCLLVFRSPFGIPLLVLLLLTRFSLFEYSVLARNYGISMLCLFALAACYERHRERGILLGAGLFVLANTNAHSVLLAGAFMVFWIWDVWGDPSVAGARAVKVLAVNAAIALLGVVACAVTIYPPFNDAAVNARPNAVALPLLLKAVLLPAESFHNLVLTIPEAITDRLGLHAAIYRQVLTVLMSVLLFGSTLGLLRRPGTFIAGLLALVGLSVFFQVFYGGQYRHEALWLVFLVAMYWIANTRPSPPTPLPGALMRSLSRVGWGLFLVLLALQVPSGINKLTGQPGSRSRDLAALIGGRPDLRDAIIIADPDYLLETVPYYLPNPTYFVREKRFGTFVYYTKAARLELSLADILEEARRLHGETDKPVIILTEIDLDRSDLKQIYHEGFNWILTTPPDQVRSFKDSTQLLAHFPPADESFSAYLLK